MATILLVDDLTAARIALRRILERAGTAIADESEGGWQVAPSGSASEQANASERNDLHSYDAELIADVRREFPEMKIIAVSATEGALEVPSRRFQSGAFPTPLAIVRLPRTFETVLCRLH